MGNRIVLTGGGTAGHVTPNIALIEVLKEEGWQIDYIGSEDSVEKEMITAINVPYHAISSGKLRRYFSWKNFLDPFKILLGILQSYRLLRKLKVDVVFSKGGFVAFPVVVGAWLNNIPIIAHESDLSPGLANRLSFPFVSKICVTFTPARNFFKKKTKVEVTGTPIRKQLFLGNKEKGLALCGFTKEKPCLLFIGGSQGANSLNTCIRQSLNHLIEHFQVIHLCGKGKVANSYQNHPGYFQMEYAKDELADLFAASDIVISRAGANSLYEILALSKPHVLIPLSRQASRGDQIQNARYFQEKGVSKIIMEEDLTPNMLVAAINEVQKTKEQIIEKIDALNISSATEKIAAMIKEQAC
ncbi:UDP-N-acetylglucosamine-N-acetylmuramyl-(pentapeptide) pyrophosphoryl-undecaprenol N-acetylglucosamine transferase (plasmid) [Legionella adelaidensis]|uniref:UDP-N-acetylglucosamine--N-acetylmuramyl-(pentapeptide) pyrophosphoryl-undecaprenol N-acetylglucosamine transferase n=1 Tax=Legionella adelaidensis TaxID=45056 RepID=A0A0W0R4L4_9GAMM|nr:undecaprenyldiphospho-muramoylpentapeptide beta-N-acetylglucosaminyltransferase [Legionella adelaidensis]KTC66017.1 undecaprenyldiphospho-muramoylpentapeptide beta-N- acetylglucosaminyltransferase [Legionella adelaidensis]VEH85768.1 UDP-N-acetylglucosamine-N-acetylmuramyl-(pentapeptide) pyrophosphoryl-undecaprenol N-acetylglucosamine transferase [Legionella adelaidensis]